MRRRIVSERVKELRAKYHATPSGKYRIETPGLNHIWSTIISKFDSIGEAVGFAREFGYKEFKVFHYDYISENAVKEIIDFREEK